MDYQCEWFWIHCSLCKVFGCFCQKHPRIPGFLTTWSFPRPSFVTELSWSLSFVVTCHRAYLRDSPAEFRESDSFCGEELYGVGWDGNIQIVTVNQRYSNLRKSKKDDNLFRFNKFGVFRDAWFINKNRFRMVMVWFPCLVGKLGPVDWDVLGCPTGTGEHGLTPGI